MTAAARKVSRRRTGSREKRARPRVLLVCPTHRDHREITRSGLASEIDLVDESYASLALEDLTASQAPTTESTFDDVDIELARLRGRYQVGGLDAVISSDDYPGSAIAALMAEAHGLPGPPLKASLVCQHKWYCRLAVRQEAPEAVPWFRYLDREDDGTEVPVPCFVKPAKSFFSVGARPVTDRSALKGAIAAARLPPRFFGPFDGLARKAGLRRTASGVLCEDLLRGHQATIEGWVQKRNVGFLGVVDSRMFPNTISFQRFEYPSSLPDSVQERVRDIATRAIRSTRYDHGMFNVEFKWDPETDRIGIVEINPRMASQFADLYEKVDGTNSYRVLTDIALGRTPKPERRRGKYAFAASCVQRVFEDRFVADVPEPEQVAEVEAEFTDARIEVLCTPGLRLSQQMQDTSSYRYGLVNLAGGDRDEVLAKFAECEKRLVYKFEAT